MKSPTKTLAKKLFTLHCMILSYHLRTLFELPPHNCVSSVCVRVLMSAFRVGLLLLNLRCRFIYLFTFIDHILCCPTVAGQFSKNLSVITAIGSLCYEISFQCWFAISKAVHSGMCSGFHSCQFVSDGSNRGLHCPNVANIVFCSHQLL